MWSCWLEPGAIRRARDSVAVGRIFKATIHVEGPALDVGERHHRNYYRILTLVGSSLRFPPSAILAEKLPKMPTQLPPPTAAQPLILCGRYIAGIATMLVALALFKLRLVRAAHATARLGERIGGGPPVFS